MCLRSRGLLLSRLFDTGNGYRFRRTCSIFFAYNESLDVHSRFDRESASVIGFANDSARSRLYTFVRCFL